MIYVVITVGVLVAYPAIGATMGGLAYALFREEDGASHDGASLAAAMIAIAWPVSLALLTIYVICAPVMRFLVRFGVSLYHRGRAPTQENAPAPAPAPLPKAKVIR